MEKLILWTPPFLFALTIHEFSHAWMANRLGDPTAKDQGRLTLNPIKHIDPIGLLMLYIAHFGWAKPVPVNPLNFKNKDRDDMLVSLAGPASNFLTAFIAGIVLRIWVLMDQSVLFTDNPIFFMINFSLFINLVLAFFNLIPVFPLDGSHVLRSFLPPDKKIAFDKYKTIGPMLLFGVIILGNFTGFNIIGKIIMPFVNFFSHIVAGF